MLKDIVQAHFPTLLWQNQKDIFRLKMTRVKEKSNGFSQSEIVLKNFMIKTANSKPANNEGRL
jgi:hypothetical protein